MILVDTSIWAQHFDRPVDSLMALLEAEQVLGHPFVIGELAMGNLARRSSALRDLHDLPQAAVASDQEVLRLVNEHRLFGRGIGYVDAHLLAATRLSTDTVLWTFDKKLATAALQLGIARVG